MFLWRPTVPDEAVVDEMYARLRDRIVSGRYDAGTVLRVSDLADAWGIAPAPVREALRRLASTGLVRGRADKAAIVAEADLDMARDAQLVVAEMHRLAVVLSTPRLTRGDIEEMRAANARFADAIAAGDVTEALAADDAFHAIAVVTSGNHTLAEVLEQYMPRIRRLEQLQFGSEGANSVARHGRLIDLCAAGRGQDAAALSDEIWQSLRLVGKA